MVVSSSATSSSSAAASRAPAISSPLSSKKDFKGVSDINKFFTAPESLHKDLFDQLTSQFETQFINNSKILHELPAKITFTVNGKKYNVFFFKNQDEMKKWSKGGEMVFETADGPITMNKTPSQKDYSQEGEEIGLVTGSLVNKKLYERICKDYKIEPVEAFNGFNEQTAIEFINELNEKKTSNNSPVSSSQISVTSSSTS